MKLQRSLSVKNIQPVMFSGIKLGKTGGLVLLIAASLLVGCQRAADTYTPEEHFQLALKAIEQNDNPAIAFHRTALLDVPEFEPHVHLLTGALDTQVGPNSPEAINDAMNELMLACQHEETRVAAFVLIGKKMWEIQDLSSAIDWLKQAEQHDKDYVPAHKWLAAIYYDLGAMQDAHDHLEQVAELDPYNAPAHFTMGIINQDYRRFDLAEKNYEKCLKRLELLAATPNKLHLPRVNRQEVLVRLAQTRIELREYKKALDALDQTLESRVVLSLQAICFRSLDRTDEARNCLFRAINQFVENPERSSDEEIVYQEARRLQGTMLLEGKEFKEARTVVEKLCEEHPYDDKSLYVLIQVYRGLGLEKEAAEKLAIHKPLRIKRERFSALHLEAVGEPDNADTRYELGNLALELGEFRIAVNWFKAALFINPEHEKTVQALNEIYGLPTDQDPRPSQINTPASKEPAAKEPAAKEPAVKEPKS